MLMAGTCSRLLNTLESVPAKGPIASGVSLTAMMDVNLPLTGDV